MKVATQANYLVSSAEAQSEAQILAKRANRKRRQQIQTELFEAERLEAVSLYGVRIK